MHESDNVAIVANDGGLPAGTELTASLVLREFVPQGHKLALLEIGEDSPIIRYGVCIGYALENLVAGSSVHEGVMRTPAAPALDGLDMGSGAPATAQHAKAPPLEGYTFLGYRNADGSVGTRNILGVTTTAQCVAGVVDHAVRRIKSELLRRFPNVDDVVAGLDANRCRQWLRSGPEILSTQSELGNVRARKPPRFQQLTIGRIPRDGPSV